MGGGGVGTREIRLDRAIIAPPFHISTPSFPRKRESRGDADDDASAKCQRVLGRESPLRLIVTGKRLPLNLIEYEDMSVVLVLPLP